MEESTKPKIFVFSSVKDGGDGLAYAMAQDGHVLASHWCSNELFVPQDLGDDRVKNDPQRAELYAKHYPDGYEIEFIKAADLDEHEGFQAAFKLNQELAAKAREEDNGNV
jgi:hypothetical protein